MQHFSFGAEYLLYRTFFHVPKNNFYGKIVCVLKLIIYNHHHHHIALVARISLTLLRHSSLSFIALGRSSGQHPASSHSCWMYVRAVRPAFARPCVGVHKSTSLMSSSLLLQQCPACLCTNNFGLKNYGKQTLPYNARWFLRICTSKTW